MKGEDEVMGGHCDTENGGGGGTTDLRRGVGAHGRGMGVDTYFALLIE
jgi:hypothetical protein